MNHYKGLVKIIVVVFVSFIFIAPSVRAAKNVNTVYQKPHEFSACLQRLGCSDKAPWGVCGSEKYPFSEENAYEKAMHHVEFTVLKTANVAAEVKNIKKCHHGCKAWFDQKVSGQWKYVGDGIWNVASGNYRLNILSDGYLGCGAPSYKQMSFCPSICTVKLNVYPVDPSVEPKDAVVIDSPPKTTINAKAFTPISLKLPQAHIAGVVSNDPASNLPLDLTEINVPLSFSQLPIDYQVSLLTNRINSSTNPKVRKKMNAVRNSLLQKKASEDIFNIWMNYTGMMTDKTLGYLPVIGPYYTTSKVIYQLTQNQWTDAFLTASTLVTKQLKVGKQTMPSYGTTSSLGQDYYQAFNNHFKPTGKATGGIDFSIIAPTPLSK